MNTIPTPGDQLAARRLNRTLSRMDGILPQCPVPNGRAVDAGGHPMPEVAPHAARAALTVPLSTRLLLASQEQLEPCLDINPADRSIGRMRDVEMRFVTRKRGFRHITLRTNGTHYWRQDGNGGFTRTTLAVARHLAA